MHSLRDREKKKRKWLFIPVNLPNLIISNNIYYLLCTRLSIRYITDITINCRMHLYFVHSPQQRYEGERSFIPQIRN